MEIPSSFSKVDALMEHVDEGCFCNLKDISEANLLDDLDLSYVFDEHIIQDLGASFGRVIRLSDTQSSCNHDIISNHHEVLSSAITEGMKYDLDESTICPVSEVSQDHCFSSDVLEGQSSGTSAFMDDEIPLEPTKTCQTTVTKLVSVMKGGREGSGLPLKTNFRVKWAPEVYDPPVSSWARMIKGRHRHHTKPTRKNYHRQKSSQIKPSRRSSSELKIPSRRSSGTRTIDLHFSRPYFPREMKYPNVLPQPSAIVGQEPKCRSSYCTGLVPSVHLPAAEAL